MNKVAKRFIETITTFFEEEGRERGDVSPQMALQSLDILRELVLKESGTGLNPRQTHTEDNRQGRPL